MEASKALRNLLDAVISADSPYKFAECMADLLSALEYATRESGAAAENEHGWMRCAALLSRQSDTWENRINPEYRKAGGGR